MASELEIRSNDEYAFSPNFTPDGKNNFCRHMFVKEDGSVHEVVRLNILDERHREEVIAHHFLMQYVSIFCMPNSESPKIEMVSRDSPWDFEFIDHNGKRFFLEICRIADEGLLTAIKAENDCIPLLQKRYLKGFEVKKLAKHFPSAVPREMLNSINSKRDKQKTFDMGSSNRLPQAFIRPPINPHIDLAEEIKIAIQKKANKNHQNKEKTTLLLDNITTHNNPIDFDYAAGKLIDFLDNTPFPSIWVYTGYYSDGDGSNHEFSLFPLKLTPEEEIFIPRL